MCPRGYSRGDSSSTATKERLPFRVVPIIKWGVYVCGGGVTSNRRPVLGFRLVWGFYDLTVQSQRRRDVTTTLKVLRIE